MISARQIRAARGLLGWDATELAEKAGLTRETISRIEGEQVAPQERTIEKIFRAFDTHGIEFTDNHGVRLKSQSVDVLIGPEGLRSFFDGVYEYARDNGGTIVQFGVDENLFWAMGTEFSVLHRARMAEIVAKRQDIKVQAIICEGDTNFIASDYNEYRWISKELFAPVPFYIYGDYLAIMDFGTVPAPTIILHKFPAITSAYRKQFDAFWNMAKMPEVVKETKNSDSTSKGKNS